MPRLGGNHQERSSTIRNFAGGAPRPAASRPDVWVARLKSNGTIRGGGRPVKQMASFGAEARIERYSGWWQHSNACTTSVLRRFLTRAYTGEDSLAPPNRVRRGCRIDNGGNPRCNYALKGSGSTERGGSQTISRRRTSSQRGRSLRAPGSGRSCRISGTWQSAHVFAAARSGSPHHHGKNRRVSAAGQLVAAAAG